MLNTFENYLNKRALKKRIDLLQKRLVVLRDAEIEERRKARIRFRLLKILRALEVQVKTEFDLTLR